MREQNWERKGPALHVSRYNSSTSALAFEWDSIFLDHWGMDIGGTHTPWNEGHSLSESACRESGTHWWRKHKSILLTHTFQTGYSNLQMRRMLQKKKPQNPNYNSPQKKNFLTCILYLLLHPLEWIVAPRNTYCRETKKKTILELLVHTHTLLKHAPGANLASS